MLTHITTIFITKEKCCDIFHSVSSVCCGPFCCPVEPYRVDSCCECYRCKVIVCICFSWSIRDHPVNSTSLSHLSILFRPQQRYTSCNLPSSLALRLYQLSRLVYLWWSRWVPPPGPECVHVASTLTSLFITQIVC